MSCTVLLQDCVHTSVLGASQLCWLPGRQRLPQALQGSICVSHQSASRAKAGLSLPPQTSCRFSASPVQNNKDCLWSKQDILLQEKKQSQGSWAQIGELKPLHQVIISVLSSQTPLGFLWRFYVHPLNLGVIQSNVIRKLRSCSLRRLSQTFVTSSTFLCSTAEFWSIHCREFMCAFKILQIC